MSRILIVLFVCSTSFGFSQDLQGNFINRGRKPLFKVNVKKTGPYFGLQQGKYLVPEIGIERQWKKIKLSNSVTHAAHMGFNYNFKYKVLGYDAGYWVKPHRIGLTYGANLFFRTDFDKGKIGIAPVIGFKLWLLHFQTGYHFMVRPKDFETNTFFVSLRVGIINDRDIEFKRKKKRKKKG
ncbi:MAG: hypothetical protein HRT57_05135 [Crocinitomicaceae bacterium]|nr:hypothetical protein [Crocinitomicaceae bacterium]